MYMYVCMLNEIWVFTLILILYTVYYNTVYNILYIESDLGFYAYIYEGSKAKRKNIAQQKLFKLFQCLGEAKSEI